MPTPIDGATSQAGFQHPTKIGAFSVLQPIGEGGMGRVYACIDENLERRVAIKMLREELRLQPVLVERFLREARAMAKISSPHVVTVHQVGEENGLPFLVMELLEGEDLAARLKRVGPLKPSDVLHFLQDAVSGLRAASDAGIIHRDVKPANLFLVNNRIKVTDFGLAKPRQIDVKLTNDGWIVGTPHYLAPESAQGKLHNEISDMYALGVSAFEMLTGRPPYVGQVALELLNAHIHKAIPRAQKYQPGVPDDVEALVFRMMAKEAVDRFPNYESLEKSLADMLERRELRDMTIDAIHSSSRFKTFHHRLFASFQRATCRLRTLRFRFPKHIRFSIVWVLCTFLIAIVYIVYRRHEPHTQMPQSISEATEIVAAGRTLPATARTPAKDLQIGHAHRVLQQEDLALLAYGRALQGGILDEDAFNYAIAALEGDESEEAVSFLAAWPHPLKKPLSTLLQSSWWPRHNALRILEQREEADDQMRRQVGLKDLVEGETCGRRRFGLLILRRTTEDLPQLLAPLRAAQRYMPENKCMQRDVKRFIQQIESTQGNE